MGILSRLTEGNLLFDIISDMKRYSCIERVYYAAILVFCSVPTLSRLTG
jgi:hypothetical protein